MNEEEIIAKVKELISINLGIDKQIINLDSDIMKDLGADSLDVVELIMKFEESFELNIPDEEVANIKTVKNIVDYISKTLNKEKEETIE